MTAEITVQYNVQEVEVTPSGVNVNVTPAEDVTVIAGVGAQGPQGIQGIQGEQGIQGIQGEPGVDGKTILYGSGVPSGGIGQNGDFYINTSTHFLYGPKTAGVWNSGISLIGPQGQQGLQGPQGVQGIPGPGIFNRTSVFASGDYTVTAADNNKLIILGNGDSLILPDDPTVLGSGFEVVIRNGSSLPSEITLAEPQNSSIVSINAYGTNTYDIHAGQVLTLCVMDEETYCVTTTNAEIPFTRWQGQALIANGLGSNNHEWSVPINPRWLYLFIDDFVEYYGKIYTGAWGTGASIGYSSEAGRPGITVFNTGTTNNGGGMVGQPQNNRILPQQNSGVFVFETSVKFQDLSTSSEEYISFFGITDKSTTGSAAHPSNGVYFYYDRATKGNYLVCRTVNAGVVTEQTAQVLSAGFWKRLTIEIRRSGGVSTAYFYIDGTLYASINTNIPSSSVFLGYSVWMNKKVGTSNRIMYCDYLMNAEGFFRE